MNYYSIGFLEGILTFRKTENFIKTYVANSNFNIDDFDENKIGTGNP